MGGLQEEMTFESRKSCKEQERKSGSPEYGKESIY